MSANPLARICLPAATAVALVAGVIAATAAQTPTGERGLPIHYSAIAMNVDPSVNLTATTVQITIDRWSSDAERDLLLKSTGVSQASLLKALQNMPKAGSIRTPDSVAYDLRYARRAPGEDGQEQIVLVTDRHISFFEAANRPRTVDYPFMVIELRPRPDGDGEGKITVATKITANTKTGNLMLENYGSLPVQLTKVRQVD